MVLLEIDANRVARLPFEGNTPGSVDVKTVALWFPLQGMEVEAWDPKILEIHSLVQHVQAPKGAGGKIRPDAGAGAELEEFFQTLVAKTSNHPTECNALVYSRRAGCSIQG